MAYGFEDLKIMETKRQIVKLRYDGRWEFGDGDTRQWTLMSSFIDVNGCDRKGGSFFYQSLVDIGLFEPKGVVNGTM